MKKIIAAALSFALLGCDAEINTTVSISQLNTDETLSSANLLIEVPSCDDYKDSRLESSSLIRAKKEIAKTFKTVEYHECYSKEFKSYASFEIPVLIGSDITQSPDINKVDFVVAKNDDQVVIITQPEVRHKLNKFKEKNSSNLNFEITITLYNDTNKTVENITVRNTFVNGTPYEYGQFSLPANAKVNIKLSDVSTQILLKTDKNPNIPQGSAKLITFN